MKTVRLSALSLIILLVVAPRFLLAQFGGTDGDSAASPSDTSHRLLPADAQALLRLREHTELFRALGLSPHAPSQRRNNRRPQTQSPRESLSPQLLELLRQMAPQQLPERIPANPDANGQQRTGTQSGPGVTGSLNEDSLRLQKLNELLQQNNLSPSELRQLQELIQPSNNGSANRSPTPGSPSGASANSRPSGLPQSERHNRPENGGLESLIGNEGPASRSGNGRPVNSRTGARNAADAHAERQEMLRQAFGIDSKTQPSAPKRAGGSPSSNVNPDQTPTHDRQESLNRNPESNLNSATDWFERMTALGISPRPGEEFDPESHQWQKRLNHGHGQRRNGSANPSHSSTSSISEQRNSNGADATDNERSKRLSEIASSEQPAWQKLQRIAQLARKETNQQSAASSEQADGSSGTGFGLSNGLTQKLADVVQSAAEATAGTVSELRNGAETPERGRSKHPNNRTESHSEIRDWASSVNDWIARLPEDDAEAPEPTASVIEGATEVESFGPATWLIGLLIGGGAWWLLRRRFGAEELEGSGPRQKPRLAANASERERLIHAFHELIHQSRCGSEEWWHHTRAVRQLTRQKPQLASAIQSLATIYEQARYSPDSEPSAEQLAAARSALKQCGKR